MRYLNEYIICLIIIFSVLFSSTISADTVQDEIKNKILDAADEAGITYDEEYFEIYERDDEMAQIFYAVACGYLIEDGDKLPLEIYNMSCGYKNNLTTIGIWRFENNGYAEDAIAAAKKMIVKSNNSTGYVYDSNKTEEENALAEGMGQLLDSYHTDISLGTYGGYGGGTSLTAHGYYSFGSGEGEEILDEMYGKVHGHSFSWVQGNLMIGISYANDNSSNADIMTMAGYFSEFLKDIDTSLDEVVIIELELVDPVMSISKSIEYFKEIDDEIVIKVKLINDMNEPAFEEVVTLLNLDTGESVSKTTGSDGKVDFTIVHANEAIELYNFKVTGMSMNKTLDIPVFEGGIELEKNPLTDKPFVGVVAVKDNDIEMMVDFADFKGGELELSQPDYGEVSGDDLNNSNEVILNNGEGILTYTPPEYLKTTDLDKMDDDGKWFATDTIKFTYTDDDGNESEYIIDIYLYRPTIVLVHGFTGGLATWQSLDNRLTELKYDTMRREYYSGDHSIEAQGVKLNEDVRESLRNYLDKGIKATKVDVVAHSMGGLITRYYINNTSYYEDFVRKLIMVGTPNHGCSWPDKLAGQLGSWILGQHESAAKQLHETSSFILNLNSGESVGAHLDPNVQYGLIYSYSSLPGFFSGDVIVSATSARLNGVTSRMLINMVHSEAFDSIGSAITNSSASFSQIEDWLEEDIYKPALKNTKIEMVMNSDDLIIKSWTYDGRVDNKVDKGEASYSNPMLLRPLDDIHTGGSKAIVRVIIDNIIVGYVHINKNTHIRIGYVSAEHINIKMFEGSARYITNNSKGRHFIVDIDRDDGEWQSVTAYDTDFVVSLNEQTEIVVIEGTINTMASTSGKSASADQVSVMKVDEDEVVFISSDGSIEEKDLDDLTGLWWEDEAYKMPISVQVITELNNFKTTMIEKIKDKGYRIYIIIPSILLLLILVIITRKKKWLSRVLMILVSVISAGLIYYIYYY